MKKITQTALVLLIAVGFVYLPEMTQGVTGLRAALQKVTTRLMERMAEIKKQAVIRIKPKVVPEETGITPKNNATQKPDSTPSETKIRPSPPVAATKLEPTVPQEKQSSVEKNINGPIGNHNWRYYDNLKKQVESTPPDEKTEKLLSKIMILKKLVALKEDYCLAIAFDERVRVKRKTKLPFAAILNQITSEIEMITQVAPFTKPQVTEIKNWIINPYCK
jgi:hypothetical protein